MSTKQVSVMKKFTEGVLLAALLAGVMSASAVVGSASCRSGVKPDQFVGAVVDCTSLSSAGMVTSVEKVVECLLVSGGPTSSAAVVCLSDLANAVGATLADVTCIIARLSNPATPLDAGISQIAARAAPQYQQHAAQFLAANRIQVIGAR